ncbi:hypothetical protein [Burkholderia cepacia]|uniref:hypothetical protein n=1 Tax=Burkholderia cepacia TaxID=292 RepID=UPI0012D90764|nr:hypothetical protein [Burkholderia cepacia]
MKAGTISPNSAGKVYLTDILMTPGDVERNIFIGMRGVQGGGLCAYIQGDSERMANIKSSSLLEYIHEGKLSVGEILHAGKNPYGNLSSMSYEERLGMTSLQINSRGGGCA